MSIVHHVAQADLNLLVVLDELLRTRSTTATARRLGRTQSAISHSLARLRSTFGDPLFVRSGAALRPTPTAEALQAPLREVLYRAEALLSRSGDEFSPSLLERTFTIAATDFAEMTLMPKLVPSLRRDAPGVDVVTLFVGDDVERTLQQGEVDLALGARFRAVAGIATEKIRDEDMLVLVRKGHPALAKRLTARSYAAMDHVLVTPRGLPGSAVDTALEPLGLARRIVLRMPHFGAAADVVSHTDLVVTVPASLARHVARRLGLVSLPVPFPLGGFAFTLAYSTTRAQDPAHAWFRSQVIAAGKVTPRRRRQANTRAR